MTWNWENAFWPNFTFDSAEIEPLEAKFLQGSGVLLGACKHLDGAEKTSLTIALISEEALKTSEIEGEYLNRDSLQSSIRRQFGLQAEPGAVSPAEQGIAELMVSVYETWREPLSHETLWRWQSLLAKGRTDLVDVGRYRTHPAPMQVVSGAVHQPKVHFEAPPSTVVYREMQVFIDWFNGSVPGGDPPRSTLIRAAMAHLHYVCIHPFEDGNGRMARALSEKALAQGLEQPTLIALAQAIERKKKAYYAALERNNKRLEITDWLVYFAETVLEAQARTLQCVEFIIAKAKLYGRLGSLLNPRQQKVLARLFEEGPDGFKGGLSAENYIRITGASRATATRDLRDLVTIGALVQTGQLRHTRYFLNA